MSSDAWKKENTVLYAFRITKSTGIPEALKTMKTQTGETETSYIKRVTIEALIRDGFLQLKEEK